MNVDSEFSLFKLDTQAMPSVLQLNNEKKVTVSIGHRSKALWRRKYDLVWKSKYYLSCDLVVENFVYSSSGL